ncbi:MAG: caspase family protein [Chloroflexi bacterium]|nr:caspase family protein [Chloroflexota bacterium]
MSPISGSEPIWNQRCWAVLVGVNRYKDDRIPDLRYCVNDAVELHDLLLSHANSGYETGRMRLLLQDETHDHCRRESILEALDNLSNQTKSEDLLLFYFSGHGDLIKGEPYLIPTNATRDRLLVDYAISLHRIKEIVQQAPANRKVVILDACHQGVILSKDLGQDDLGVHEFGARVKGEFMDARGIAVLAASTHDQKGRDVDRLRHGLFTYFLLEALKGKADANADAWITVKEVVDYASPKVALWAAEHSFELTPTWLYEGTAGDIKFYRRGKAQLELITEPTQVLRKGPNPISAVFPRPISKAQQFHDRSEELDRIQRVLSDTLDKPMPIIVQGERCIGKTSLLNRVKQMLDITTWPDRKLLHFAIDSGNICACADLAREIRDGVQAGLRKVGIGPNVEATGIFTFDTYARFAAEIESLLARSPQVTFVVFMDEYDRIIHQCDDLEQQRIMGLLRYLVEASDLPITFVLSRLEDWPPSYGSPLDSSADLIILRPLKRTDCDAMVRDLIKGCATINQDGLDWLYAYTGGHPHVTKLLLWKLFDHYSLDGDMKSVSVEMLQTAGQQARTSARADSVLDDIYATYMDDDERYVLLWMAVSEKLSAAKVAEAGGEIRSAIKKLERRDYLTKEPDGGYRFRIGFLGDWLHSWPKFEAELERLQVPNESANATGGMSQTGSSELPDRVIHAGVCIDLTTQRVYVEGQRVQSDPADSVYRLLVFLAERCDQIVDKEEVAQYLWPEEENVATDQSISALMHRLRNTLSDKQRPYKYLDTLRKRGFRLRNATLVRTKPMAVKS